MRNQSNNPSVSMITVSCFTHRLALLRLYECIKAQFYKNITEWIIYNNTTADNQAEFSLFLDNLISRNNLVLSNTLDIRVINHGADRNTESEDYEHLNALNAAAKGDVVVVMCDRDYYSPNRVSSAVNMLKGSQSVCAGILDQRMYVHKTGEFVVSEYTNQFPWTMSLAYMRDPVARMDLAFTPEDSIYTEAVGFIEVVDNALFSGERSVLEICDNSFMCLMNVYLASVELTDYPVPIQRAIDKSKKLMDCIFSLSNNLVKSENESDCPICYTGTFCKLVKCNHSLCGDCIKQMAACPKCPICRSEMARTEIGNWDLSISYGSDEYDSEDDSDDEDDRTLLTEDEDEDEDEAIYDDADDYEDRTMHWDEDADMEREHRRDARRMNFVDRDERRIIFGQHTENRLEARMNFVQRAEHRLEARRMNFVDRAERRLNHGQRAERRLNNGQRANLAELADQLEISITDNGDRTLLTVEDAADISEEESDAARFAEFARQLEISITDHDKDRLWDEDDFRCIRGD